MFPITAALALANTIAQIILLDMQSQSEETRTIRADRNAANVERFFRVLDKLFKHGKDDDDKDESK